MILKLNGPMNERHWLNVPNASIWGKAKASWDEKGGFYTVIVKDDRGSIIGFLHPERIIKSPHYERREI